MLLLSYSNYNKIQNTYTHLGFDDVRYITNKKIFAWIFEREGYVWINVKCDLEWRDFWRSAYESVVPAFHLNKKHWNSIILDETIPDKDIHRMIEESYDLTKPKLSSKKK